MALWLPHLRYDDAMDSLISSETLSLLCKDPVTEDSCINTS